MSKYLINSDYVAVRRGDFVEASETAAEFILDTGNNDLHISVMIEIAEANGLKIDPELKTSAYADTLEIKLYQLDIPEVNKMTDTQNVDTIVKAGFEAGKTDEDMIIELLESGVKFKEAGKLFKAACERLGLRKSAKNRKEEVFSILDEAEFAPENSDQLTQMVEYIAGNVDDTSEKQALAAIKSWAKVNEVELPKAARAARAAKSTVTVAGATGARAQIFNWMIGNKGFASEELSAFIAELKPKFDEKQLANTTKKFVQYAEFAELYAAGPVEEVVAEEVEAA